MAEWWSIEVFHSDSERASRWKDAYGQALTEAAITHQAVDWTWIEHRYGVVFEVCFADDEQWQRFRDLASVRAALDGTPDPVNGLIIYRGRGGGAGARKPRRPTPAAGAGALELPEPVPAHRLKLTSSDPGAVARELTSIGLSASATLRDEPRHRPSRCRPCGSRNPSRSGAAGVPAPPDPRSS